MDLLTSETLKNLVRAYQSEPGPARDRAIQLVVSDPRTANIVRTWLDSHPELADKSLVFSELRNRLITPVSIDSPKTNASSSFISNAISYASKAFKKMTRSIDNADIENAIITGKLETIGGYLRDHPEKLIESADLLKMYISIGTLSLEELMPILSGAAKKMMETDSPSFPSTAVIEPNQRPSLFRLFREELAGFISSYESLSAIEDIKALIKQDSGSADPYILGIENLYSYCKTYLAENKKVPVSLLSLLPMNFLVEFVSSENDEGETLLHQQQHLETCLPVLLENLSARDIRTVLSKSAQNEDSPWNLMIQNMIQTLSNSQCLRLSAMIATTENIPQALLEILPQFAKDYLISINQNEANIVLKIQSIKDLPELSSDEKDAAIAHLIESKEIALSNVLQVLSETELLRLTPYLRYLDLRGFINIPLAQQLLKKCQNLNILKINNAEILNSIKELPNCQELDCPSSDDLTVLPALPQCQKLNCCSCSSLRTLPALPQCRKLDCTNCVSLAALPALPQCKELNCALCSNLTFVPSLPVCETFLCYNCHRLTALPTMPRCRYLDYSSSRGIRELPELPFNAQVVSDGSVPYRQIDVNIEQIYTEPETLLLTLGQHLLNNRPFPNVCYFENGKSSEAIDAGGVRRDFVTKICERVFKKDFNKDDQGKFLNLRGDVPLATEGSDTEEQAYRTLGVLFAMCYVERSDFKTGPIFSENMYQYLTAKGVPGSDEWLLSNLFRQAQFPSPEILTPLINGQGAMPQLQKKDLISLSVLYNDEADPNQFTQEYLQNNREQIRGNLLALAKEDRGLLAVSWIGKEMKRKLGDEYWGALVAQGPQVLKERVEGKLDAETLKTKLIWHPSPNVSPQQLDITKNYLTTWIDEQNLEQLSRFLQFVTGNKSLSASDLIINVVNRGDALPTASTCSFTAYISAEYKSQDDFNQKLNQALTEGLSGSGFSFA